MKELANGSLDARAISDLRGKTSAMRSLLALSQTSVDLNDGRFAAAANDSSIDMSNAIRVDVPKAPIQAMTGLKVDPLTDAEVAAVKNGIKSQLDTARAAAEQLMKDQFGSFPPSAGGLGGMDPVMASSGMLVPIEAQLNQDLKSVGTIGYQAIVRNNPVLMYVKSAAPSDQEILEANRAYVKKLNEQIEALNSMPISPDDTNSRAMIFFGPSVVDVLQSFQTQAGKNNFCGALNGVYDNLKKTESFNSALQTAGGVAEGVVCLSTLFAPPMGFVCMALGGVNLGITGALALNTWEEQGVMEGGALAGGDIARYQSLGDQLNSYLLNAGLSAAGMAGGAVIDALTSARPQNLVSSANHAVGVLTPTGASHVAQSHIFSDQMEESLSSLISAHNSASPEDLRELAEEYLGAIRSPTNAVDREPPDVLTVFRSDQRTTLFPQGTAPASIPTSASVVRQNNISVTYGWTDSSGRRFEAIVCRSSTCTTAGATVHAGEITTYYPVCGPGVVGTIRLTAARRLIESAAAVSCGDFFFSVNCTASGGTSTSPLPAHTWPCP